MQEENGLLKHVPSKLFKNMSNKQLLKHSLIFHFSVMRNDPGKSDPDDISIWKEKQKRVYD